MNTPNNIHADSQKFCAWGGPVLVISMFLGWGLIGKFIPLPAPTDTPEQIVTFFLDDPTRLRIGLLLCLFGAPFLGLWAAAISVQIKRIEGQYSPLTYAQLVLGGAAIVEFTTPLAIWAGVAFRPEVEPLITYRLNDVAWILWLAVGQSFVLQAIVLGVAILKDKRANPIFPRWLAYFNFWSATLFLPSGLCIFFKTGPFAWNGIITWWLVALSYGAWVCVISAVLHFRVIPDQEAENARQIET